MLQHEKGQCITFVIDLFIIWSTQISCFMYVTDTGVFFKNLSKVEKSQSGYYSPVTKYINDFKPSKQTTYFVYGPCWPMRRRQVGFQPMSTVNHRWEESEPDSIKKGQVSGWPTAAFRNNVLWRKPVLAKGLCYAFTQWPGQLSVNNYKWEKANGSGDTGASKAQVSHTSLLWFQAKWRNHL